MRRQPPNWLDCNFPAKKDCGDKLPEVFLVKLSGGARVEAAAANAIYEVALRERSRR
jgi:hypothetical protein